ncbi:DUF4249 domain-containing protein [Salinimicrobium tongyeongense]|uniref:DUF4249 domain-containing protein n=1 Tax=Salinimicrobium tongyeongense TaxID=2809707 RepID=A0ABY6NN55_9FLAO|nr:DUF4249 domain-containing protein [Salinimicrobium tongyeongense]UZH54319.1 DUF4249 domain-containing protein [Salinimicrobium tongyeongense]
MNCINIKSVIRQLLLLVSAMVINSCVEPYEFETETFENLLVVEALITDEVKTQEVRLTRTYELEKQIPAAETNAVVTITDDTGTQFRFYESDTPGIYLSSTQFAARPQHTYQLQIETRDGNSYISDSAALIPGAQIDNLYAERGFYQGEDGVALMVDSEYSSSASRYALYEYEETYKIVSPYTVRNTIKFEGNNWSVVPNTRQETVCYNTVPSNDIILSNTSSLSDNELKSFVVRFIDAKNPVLAQRYSILVKQYSLTPEAFSYYSTLKKISGSGSVLSPTQPGFVSGNIRAANENEKVIGFFTLSSTSSKRVYFNYHDFFAFDERRPQFPESCLIFRPGENFDTPIGMIKGGTVRYYSMAGAPVPGELGEGPMRVISTECVDCTVYGTNQAPDFWTE